MDNRSSLILLLLYPDDGYYEDMYPAADDDPSTYRPQTAVALDLIGLHDDDDDAVNIDVDDTRQLTTRFDDALAAGTSTDVRMSPLPAAVRATPHMYTNLVFDVRVITCCHRHVCHLCWIRIRKPRFLFGFCALNNTSYSIHVLFVF